MAMVHGALSRHIGTRARLRLRALRRAPSFPSVPVLCGALALSAVAALSAADAYARPRVEVELLGGAPLNLDSRFTLTQDGFDPVRFDGSYYTQPLEFPLYYAVRIGLAGETTGWSLDYVHHKIYLKHRPPEIQVFEVTHGFNILTVQRAWTLSRFRVHAGVGMVWGRPESVVRGETLDAGGFLGTGYHLIGPALGAGVGKRIGLGDSRYFLTLEGRATVAPVHVPVTGGEASFTSVVFHGMAGFGAAFGGD